MRTATRFPLQRIAALDRAIREGKYPNACSLGRELEVCARTVQRDVEFLRERLGAPLAFDQQRNGYTYTDPGYQLPFLTLTEGELVALFLAERVLQQYRGTPFAPDLARAFTKVTAGLTDRIIVDLRHLGQAHSFRTSSATPLDADLFRTLHAAILGRQRLRLRYWTASRDEETWREVDPYHLASVDGQWYLVGYCHLRHEVRMFVPGRIRSVDLTETVFEAPEDFRIEDYLSQSFAVLRGVDGKSYRVRLRFRGEAVKYVRERVWHASQIVEPISEGELMVVFELSHLREVERWVLSWGSDCTVIEPPELKQQIARALTTSLANYTPTADPAAPHRRPRGRP